jgi:hypothetical protein
MEGVPRLDRIAVGSRGHLNFKVTDEAANLTVPWKFGSGM